MAGDGDVHFFTRTTGLEHIRGHIALGEGLQQARQQARTGFGAQIKARGQWVREHGQGPVLGDGAGE